MGRGDVQDQDVLAAIAEHDRLGQQAFLDKYDFGKSTKWVLHHDDKEYDSKAIFAAAHGHHAGLSALTRHELRGGEDDAAKYLRDMGFEVYSSRGPTWERDEIILACDLVYRNGWKGLDARDERVVELSDLLQQLPIHPAEVRGPKFRNPNGVARKTADLATHHPDYTRPPTKGGAGDLLVLNEFLADGPKMAAVAAAIRDGVRAGYLLGAIEAVPDIDDLEAEAIEGRLLERRHFARERDRGLRRKKIAGQDRLVCFTCGFDFQVAYGEHGEGYIECHHVLPLHVSGPIRTRLSDLVLICANCHRMIHRKSPWLTPDQLLDVTSRNYDLSNQAPNRSGSALFWHTARPPLPDHYDIAYEADYRGLVFRAIRSCSMPTSWRLERDKPATGELQDCISHEDSLLDCKKRVEREIAENGWFAR